jgi:CRP-like cAMP-binding protein
MPSYLLALAIGALAAAALPLGAAVGLAYRPAPRVTSAFMAFGAGAILFALSVDLVAESFREAGFLPVAAGAVTGGLVFQILNQLLSRRGAFLRKVAVAARYLSREKRRRGEQLLETLSGVHLLQALPPEQIVRLLSAIRPVHIAQDETLFHEGDAGTSLYMIERGAIGVTRGGKQVAVLGAGETVGEIAIVTGLPRVATIIALEPTDLLLLPKHAFDELLAASPELRRRVEALVSMRVEELKEHLLASQADLEEWRRRARNKLQDEVHVTRDDVAEAAATRGATAATAIWLGCMLDGIPEGLALGSTAAAAAISWPLFGGVVMSNLPEAMSASLLMREAGMSRSRIFWTWASLVPLTALAALVGGVYLSGVTSGQAGYIDGLAAGALLVVIAETVLPEAFERGGAVVGLSTLLGFLSALALKTIG